MITGNGAGCRKKHAEISACQKVLDILCDEERQNETSLPQISKEAARGSDLGPLEMLKATSLNTVGELQSFCLQNSISPPIYVEVCELIHFFILFLRNTKLSLSVLY